MIIIIIIIIKNINLRYCDKILLKIRAVGGLQVWSLPILTAIR